LERAVALDVQWRQRSAREAWVEVLAIPNGDAALLLRAIGNLVFLPREITLAVQKLRGINPKNLTGWIPKFMQPWTTMDFNVQFVGFMTPVDETMLSMLRVCDDLLSHQLPEPVAPEAELKQ